MKCASNFGLLSGSNSNYRFWPQSLPPAVVVRPGSTHDFFKDPCRGFHAVKLLSFAGKLMD